jgi:hypothetical protein
VTPISEAPWRRSALNLSITALKRRLVFVRDDFDKWADLIRRAKIEVN